MTVNLRTIEPQHSEADVRKRDQGAHAANLLEDDLLKEAFSAQRQEYIEALERGVDLRKPADVLEIVRCLRAVGMAQEHLHSVVNGGKAAEAQLNAVDKAKDWFRKKRA